MCLYSQRIKNKKYEPNATNKGIPAICTDERKRGVETKCGRCIECKRERKREWRIRLAEEVKQNVNDGMRFVTLTISEEAGAELEKACGSDLADDIARIAVRRFCERWRKEFKRAPKHWLNTELGGNNTERLHFHGFIWGKDEDIIKHWKYGKIMIGGYEKTGKRVHYISEKSINYMTKYIIKIDKKHPTYQSKLFTSKGMGISYIDSEQAKMNKYKGADTYKKYKFSDGSEAPLPLYYKAKLWTDEQRDKLWTNHLDKGKVYIMGNELKSWINITDEKEQAKRIAEYQASLLYHRQINKTLGYGNASRKWKQHEYSWKLKEKHDKLKKVDELKKISINLWN